MLDLQKYQRKAVLKDGTKIVLRPMVAEDKDALYELFKAVPHEEARYLRDDISDRLIVERWADSLDYSKTLPILAIINGKIIADATLNRRRSGWKWHLGTVRVFVHEDYRKVGLGHKMIEELVDVAGRLELEKLVAEIPDQNTAAIHAFRKAGFHRAAVIAGLAKDRENQPVDVVVMVRDLKPRYDYEYDL
jgi:RimJ/RimL family protein N-acetyltransferase